jgi:hypothetical protein
VTKPEDLLRLRRELFEHSIDVVQGWRSPVGRERGARYNLSRGLNFPLNETFGMEPRDNKSGFITAPTRSTISVTGSAEPRPGDALSRRESGGRRHGLEEV